MNFAHEPLSDAAAQEESRSQLRGADARPCYIGEFRQVAVALPLTLVCGFFSFAGVVHGTTVSVFVAVPAAIVGILCLVWYLSAHLHDQSASARASEIRTLYAPADDQELKSLLGMKEQHPEIEAAVRRWTASGVTIRNRDVRAARAWLFKVEPVRQRKQLLEQLAS